MGETKPNTALPHGTQSTTALGGLAGWGNTKKRSGLGGGDTKNLPGQLIYDTFCILGPILGGHGPLRKLRSKKMALHAWTMDQPKSIERSAWDLLQKSTYSWDSTTS